MAESELDRNRRLYPEFAAVCDRFRGSITAAWIVKDGECVAGRPPPGEYKTMWLDPETVWRVRDDYRYYATLKVPRSWCKRVDNMNGKSR
ncbi:MAG TPA: hypothetical protein VFH85_07875 [Gammaproteobacteria bacterium]|nr:hypothetical protein [Gammaproteobacteria bacterium]